MMKLGEVITLVEGLVDINGVTEFSDGSGLVQANFSATFKYEVAHLKREVDGNGAFTFIRNEQGKIEPESVYFRSYGGSPTTAIEWRWDGNAFQIVQEVVAGSDQTGGH